MEANWVNWKSKIGRPKQNSQEDNLSPLVKRLVPCFTLEAIAQAVVLRIQQLRPQSRVGRHVLSTPAKLKRAKKNRDCRNDAS